MKDKIKALKEKNDIYTGIYHPVFYRIAKDTDLKAFNILLETNTKLAVFDEIESQLEELVKLQNPKKRLAKEELKEAARQHLGNTRREVYGVWVFYPWSNKLVHILDENEFIEVRTNRNQHKITIEERTKLSRLKIGVVGLSVGKTISLTMAMERTFGEIRLADFDTLELSNINRLQTSLYSLGLSKAVITAREIAEIDPFLKTICYTDGLTEENMDDFFTKGGKLDIYVDECDGLDIKILGRLKAKALGIPVVSDMNDRGTLDVERFDLEPNRPLLHGYIDHLDISRLKDLKTNEEKVPYILPMIGSETISSKLKASMLEIGESITTWPQLASSVVLGGALAADVCRRIALDEFHESGRYFVDLEELVCDKSPQHLQEPVEQEINKSLTEEEIQCVINKMGIGSAEATLDLLPEMVEKLVAAAILAPSGGNAQPWKWHYFSKKLYLFHDEARSHSLLDFENMASYIALGTASENLILKAHELGYEVKVESFPISNVGKLVAIFTFAKNDSETLLSNKAEHACDELVNAIDKRITNRTIGERQAIDRTSLENLRQVAATLPGADLILIDDEQVLTQIGMLLGKIDRMRLLNKRGHHDFIKEIKWSHEDAVKTRDGVDIDTIDLTPTELSGFKMARDWEVMEHLIKWKGGTAFEKLSRKAIQAASAVGLITMPCYSKSNFYQGGRALERVWLKANQERISLQPQSTIIFLLARLIHGKGIELTNNMKEELLQLNEEFSRLFNLENRQGIFLFRLFAGNEPKVKSLRLPIEDVLSFQP